MNPAVLADHDVGVGIEGEKRAGQRLDALQDVAPHQQPAVRRDVVAEGQLGEVAAVERDQETPEEAAERDPAVAFVRGDAVSFPLRDS